MEEDSVVNFCANFPLNHLPLATKNPTELNDTIPFCIKYKNNGDKIVKIWQCNICSKSFSHQYTLMRHLPTHTDERRFQCNVCCKAFRQMSTLSQHKAIHSQERPYICETCQKTFNRVSTLISHRKTHTGSKAHQCHMCNKSFHQKGNLRNHIFTHTNERPYKCNECDKGFNQMSNLVCHKMKAHLVSDKINKYQCQVCNRYFNKRAALRNHEMYEHGNDVPHAVQCNTNNSLSNNIIFVDPINTRAMRLAVEENKTPFALLRPLNSIPVLVKVLPAPGNKQMLVPAHAEDLKKYGQISVIPKSSHSTENCTGTDDGTATVPDEELIMAQNSLIEDEGNEDIDENSRIHLKIDTSAECQHLPGNTVKIKIPVVATVIQQSNGLGKTCMSVLSPGPNGLEQNVVESRTDELIDSFPFGSVDILNCFQFKNDPTSNTKDFPDFSDKFILSEYDEESDLKAKTTF